MKICHFITYYLPTTQNWIYNQLIRNAECKSFVLCQRLIDPEQFPFKEVYPICPSSGINSIPERFVHKIFERYPVRHHSSVIYDIKPDVLHGHFLLESWRNYHLIKKLGIPLVTTCYGQDITSLPKKMFWKRRCEKIFDIGAAFIVEGPHMGETLAGLGCPREKINVIKLGVDTAAIGGMRSKRNYGDGDKVRILFTGLGREKKGAVYAALAFVKASSIIKNNGDDIGCGVDLELHLLGDGVYRKQVEKILSDAGVGDKAVFHGATPVVQYRRLLRGMDIVLAPSVRAADGDTEGGAPVVVIEALCAGIPVAGSTHCDIPNIVSHGSTGLLSNERDVDALAKDIVTLSTNKKLRLDMGKRGAKYARDEHDIVTQVRKISDVYRSVHTPIMKASTRG